MFTVLLPFLLLGATPAHAACTLLPTSPTAGSTLSSAPTFQWTEIGCNVVSLQAAPTPPSSTNATTLTTTWGNGPRSYTLADATWQSYAAGSWSDGMCWRLVGRAIPGTTTYGPWICVSVSADADGDGYTEAEGDCDDTNAAINPGAAELCDENYWDEDCNGHVGEYDDDDDGDGWRGCDHDCNDDEYWIHPGLDEVCNGIDEDCDSAIDEDNDGDGYAVCDDCADYAGWEGVNPGATEVINGIDDDCDGYIDETTSTYDPYSLPY